MSAGLRLWNADADAPHTAIGSSLGALVRIFEPGVQIAWFDRTPVPTITEYLQAAARGLAAGRSCPVRHG
ncbi:hypothetical protein [Thioalkalivibrio paradoxus]|uniref:hypothetical protein n=1 Tax=Thioalkalivibrio paradoxus TaxID=108010 RepID=UPI00022C265F|nr:hypothetical protein [Thioalkalivibrio paradoxus]